MNKHLRSRRQDDDFGFAKKRKGARADSSRETTKGGIVKGGYSESMFYLNRV